MDSRGKKKRADRPVDWKISLPESVTAPVALILSNPLTGLPRHGARSRLIEQLLREWLEKQQKGGIQLDTTAINVEDDSGLDELER